MENERKWNREKVDRMFEVPENCRNGKHQYSFNKYCGADVCTECGDHKGLARCYCGFGLAPGDSVDFW